MRLSTWQLSHEYAEATIQNVQTHAIDAQLQRLFAAYIEHGECNYMDDDPQEDKNLYLDTDEGFDNFMCDVRIEAWVECFPVRPTPPNYLSHDSDPLYHQQPEGYQPQWFVGI